MMRRLRRGIAARQGIPPARRRGKMPRKERRGDVLKGSMKNVIVVHPPGGIFSEAVFILRDDYFQTPGISREALLRQARAAAEEYAAAYSPPGGRRAAHRARGAGCACHRRSRARSAAHRPDISAVIA